MRQLDPDLEPYPVPEGRSSTKRSRCCVQRAELVDTEELPMFDHWVAERARQWETG